ncbi:Glutamine synthetase [uncultured archaeon]|nr:Glutamine synthetase [uncultured archaeon]
MSETDNLIKQAIKDKVKFIDLQFTDMFGTLKSVEIPIDCLKEALDRGVWFDGSSIKGYTRIMESDMYLKPDISTYAIIPGDNNETKTARIICDVYTPEGKLYEGDPRNVLKKVMKEAKMMGYEFRVGPEVEFYLFRKDEKGKIQIPDNDTGSYFDCSIRDAGSEIRKEVMNALSMFGIESERSHHEVGNGQHEIGFHYGDPLSTADKVITLKHVIKMIAHKHGLIASFMPKPLYKKAGSGMHVHFSLFDIKGKNAFYDDKDLCKLSKTAKEFIAGELKYVKEMNALLNPTVNSYKRLVVGYEAPVYTCWGRRNRSALVRLPRFTEGRESSVRGELRCPDPSANPYLAFAAMLKAGLEGIKQKLELMSETEDSVYEKTKEELEHRGITTLPGSLTEAVEEMKKSKLMNDLLGDDLFNKYAKAKEKEAEEYRTIVTEWEVEKYL